MNPKNFIDMAGFTFGKLKVVIRVENGVKWRTRWECLCECGRKTIVYGSSLRSGNTVSCGCYQRDVTVSRNHIHGFAYRNNTAGEYRIWANMIARCENKKIANYRKYGAKGVKVCKRWASSFEAFILDMGQRPSDKHSLDRFPNIYGDYEPENCRWATISEQARNRTDNTWYEHEGIRLVLQDWASNFKTHRSNLARMLKKKSFDEVYKYYTTPEIRRKCRSNTEVN